MAALLLSDYLERIGCPAPPEPTLEGLTQLQSAHIHHIPFENLDVLLGCGVRLDLASLQAKLVASRRGGYCFEHNLLFLAALRELGFEATPISGRVWVGSQGVTPPPTHMLLLVELDGATYLCDAAFGAFGCRQPVPLREGTVVPGVCERHRLARTGDEWRLEGEHQGRFVTLYSFTLERRELIDYEVANHYTSTHPESRFRQQLMVQRSTAEGRVLLRNDELIRQRAGDVEARRLTDRSELVRVLAEEFGLRVPEAAQLRVPAVPTWT